MNRGVFRVLLVWLDRAELYRSPTLEDHIPPEQLERLQAALARGRPRSFGLLVERNYDVERASRNVRLPPEIADLYRIPEGAAVDRLLGHHDGDRWHPGIAGLEPQEARAIRCRVLEHVPTDVACAWLKVERNAYYKFVSEGRRKLKLFMGLPWGKMPEQGEESPAVRMHEEGAAPDGTTPSTETG